LSKSEQHQNNSEITTTDNNDIDFDFISDSYQLSNVSNTDYVLTETNDIIDSLNNETESQTQVCIINLNSFFILFS
jgi:hypothetical protein